MQVTPKKGHYVNSSSDLSDSVTIKLSRFPAQGRERHRHQPHDTAMKKLKFIALTTTTGFAGVGVAVASPL